MIAPPGSARKGFVRGKKSKIGGPNSAPSRPIDLRTKLRQF